VCEADAYTRGAGAAGDDNFGNQSRISLKNTNVGSGFHRDGFLRFDVSHFSPRVNLSSRVVSVELLLTFHSQNQVTNDTTHVYLMRGDWDETTITFNNQPNYPMTHLGVSAVGPPTAPCAGCVNVIPLDPFVVTELFVNGSLSLMVSCRNTGPPLMRYISREYTGSTTPSDPATLRVTWEPVVTTTAAGGTTAGIFATTGAGTTTGRLTTVVVANLTTSRETSVGTEASTSSTDESAVSLTIYFVAAAALVVLCVVLCGAVVAFVRRRRGNSDASLPSDDSSQETSEVVYAGVPALTNDDDGDGNYQNVDAAAEDDNYQAY
jgi:hypothetical protein